MSEKETIKQLQDLISDFNLSDGFDIRVNATDVKALQTVLKMSENKDKIIDEMSKQLYIEGFCREIKCVECKKEPKECIKQYFENKLNSSEQK